MRIRVRAFRLWKAGNSADEYEDACWPERAVDREARAFRCAVADGATETSFAAVWARLLARSYCRGHLSPRALPRHLPALGATWREAACARPLPWYAEEKVRSGAFAALAGLTLWHDARGIHWSAAAAGDCCLFQVRSEGLLTAFPISTSDAFSSRPYLISSNAHPGNLSPLAAKSGGAAPGDRFFLMSDALASWFLAAHEAGGQPWRELYCSGAFDGGSFDGWIGDLRREKRIRNDDVTLLALAVT
jgi:hypothetical protein